MMKPIARIIEAFTSARYVWIEDFEGDIYLCRARLTPWGKVYVRPNLLYYLAAHGKLSDRDGHDKRGKWKLMSEKSNPPKWVAEWLMKELEKA